MTFSLGTTPLLPPPSPAAPSWFVYLLYSSVFQRILLLLGVNLSGSHSSLIPVHPLLNQAHALDLQTELKGKEAPHLGWTQGSIVVLVIYAV